jgi:aldose 1-epimerase
MHSDSLLALEPFGTLPTGEPIERYTLGNAHGMRVRIATYGGTLTSLTAPDSGGHWQDVVLGHDTLDEYLDNRCYLGAVIGRCANRIARGRFELNGRQIPLAINDGPNALHGGNRGFDKVVWTVTRAQLTPQGPQLRLAYVSHAGEEGYPGTLWVSVVYTLTHNNTLHAEFNATTDRDTIVNLTQHTYFNLHGHGDILGHVLQIHADRFTPVDDTLIPTGEVRSVEGTAFDFRQPIPVGMRIDDDDEQLRIAKGYDHNWIIDKPAGMLAVQAVLEDPQSGRVLEVASTEPGLQVYSGNFLDGTPAGKGGSAYSFRSGLALEPQHFPDSPNHPSFPSVLLDPGRIYRNTIEYRFSARPCIHC